MCTWTSSHSDRALTTLAPTPCLLYTSITASMQTCLIRFGEIVQIQNAMIQKMHALSDEIFQLRAQAGLENVICRASGQQEAPKGWDEADPSIPEP